MAALSRRAIAHAPPEKPITFDWPDSVSVNQRSGRRRQARLAARTGEDEPPEWLVFGAMIRTVSMAEGEPGLNPLVTALEEEGFTDGLSEHVVESFARHLMVPSTPGRRAASAQSPRIICRGCRAKKALRRDIDDNGDLLVRRMGKVRGRTRGAAAAARRAGMARSCHQGAAGVKLLRTIRLDPSDTFVFEQAAEPGEWAVSGAFVFWTVDPAALQGKARSAFRGGFLGVDSLGWSTLVQIVEASEDDRVRVIDMLAEQLVAHFGAPDMDAARAAAAEEVAFAESLCNQPPDTLVALHRSSRTARCARPSAPCVRAKGPKPMRVFASSKSKARTMSSRRIRSI